MPSFFEPLLHAPLLANADSLYDKQHFGLLDIETIFDIRFHTLGSRQQDRDGGKGIF